MQGDKISSEDQFRLCPHWSSQLIIMYYELHKYQLIMNSKQSNLYILVIDPGKQTEIVRVPDMGSQETTEAIVAAKDAYKSWSKVPARVLTHC